jgi:metal-responsive CopG/Arc/MetJ family transcriptional regulator
VSFDFLKSKTTPVNITLPLWLRHRIDRSAKEAGLNRSQYIVKAARAYGGY